MTAADIDARLQLSAGSCLKLSGVATRRMVTDELASDMAAAAAQDALAAGGFTLGDIDLMICASGTPEQPIPCNAALIQRKLGDTSGTPCFDVNSTCMSFIVALDVAGALVSTGRYTRVLVVSADVASCGLNENEPEAYALLGDAAAAAVIGKTPAHESSARILGSTFATFGEGAEMTEIRGGGSKQPSYLYSEATRADYLFHMDGTRVFRMAMKVFPPMVDRLLAGCGVAMEESTWRCLTRPANRPSS